MTSRMLMPWRRWPQADPDRMSAGAVDPTPILDWRSRAVSELLSTLDRDIDPLPLLRAAHFAIAACVAPVYALDDVQPVSRTLARGRGSCSQRLAVLEAVARARGITTRCRGLLVDGRFWYPRFPRLHFLVPDVVLLAWPEFNVDTGWISASELFGPLEPISAGGFTNAGGETLFDALARTSIDWDGVTSEPGTCSACDLSARVVADLGRYASRDELFAMYGQTMCRPARVLAAPMLDRWSAGAVWAAA